MARKKAQKSEEVIIETPIIVEIVEPVDPEVVGVETILPADKASTNPTVIKILGEAGNGNVRVIVKG